MVTHKIKLEYTADTVDVCHGDHGPSARMLSVAVYVHVCLCLPRHNRFQKTPILLTAMPVLPQSRLTIPQTGLLKALGI